MNFFLPFLSAGAQGFGSIFDKLNLRRTGIGFRTLFVLIFLIMFLAIGAYILIAHLPLPKLDPPIIGLIAIIILVSFAQNIFELKGIQAMDMNVREPISNLEPILTGVLAFLIFPSEGNIRYLVAIVLGAFIVMWSSNTSHSLKSFINIGTGYVFADVSLSAILDNLSKFALLLISAAYLPLFRTGGILILSLIFLRPTWKQAHSRGLALAVVSGILFAVAAVAKAFSVQSLGLNFTILIMLLQPGLIYLLSYATLKEHFTWRPIIGSVGVLALIVLTQFS